VTAPAGQDGGAAALLVGTLAKRGGCLVVEGNGRAVHLVFPAGKAVWDEASGTLRVGGKTYRPGDPITLGGGGISSPSTFLSEKGVEITPCTVTMYWVVVA
jgi:hypothetical protein